MTDREALTYLLKNESSLTTQLSTRSDGLPAIYYGQIGKGETGKPCIVILRDEQTYEIGIMKNSQFTLNIYGNSLGESEDIARTVYNVFNGSKGWANGFAFGKINIQTIGSFTDIELYYSVVGVSFQYRQKQEDN